MPTIDSSLVTEAMLALEGTVIQDFQLPLPGNLKDISKAAALVSGVIEDRIPALLNSVRDRTWDPEGQLHSYEFRRFPIGFPDILLVDRSNPQDVLLEIEAKSWYVLSGDPLTARFETAPDVMRDGAVVAVVAWLLDGVVSGSPKLFRIYVDDAKRLALARDQAWTADGATHRVVPPVNAPETPRNLLKTQSRGEFLSDGRWVKDADNYGKLERFHDEKLRAFRNGVWDLSVAGKPLREWQAFIKKS